MAQLALSLDLNSTLGADFVGFAVSSVVYGILTAQVYTYLKKYPLDKTGYKLLVASLWVLETVDQAFIGHQFYFYCITNYGNPLVLIDRPGIWSLVAQVEVGALAGSIVKACFAMRVYRFSNQNIYVSGLIILMILTQLGEMSFFMLLSRVTEPYDLKAPRQPIRFSGSHGLKSLADLVTVKGLGSSSLALGVATDAVTAFALCYFLQGLRTGYAGSDSLVNSLTLYAVNTGILTSAFSLATLILYNIMPANFIFMAFYFVVSKLYAISFLATLNTRRIVRGQGTDRERSTGTTFQMFTNPRVTDPVRRVEEGVQQQKYPGPPGLHPHQKQPSETHYMEDW
ncbi:hypothetical protein JAAARDRAFT_199904 [Jaapia argillacea MUCL 33604]|uniref:DUF6534 domain-containing protein n=1 Tax=Jaapia argillacea MUCL 33604 TaxID=933084 RepID=A0A067PHL6_9AGAM|nr:hypothetical protein JAAARDRAFT_199904 [Jaapia argillacea MUCL 33604]